MIARCLYCYQPLEADRRDFHVTCSKKIFGTPEAPELPYTEDEMDHLALQVVQSQFTVTGVQPKIALDIPALRGQGRHQFTIVGLWGRFILKPPQARLPALPENEDLTMHLAALAKIPTVPHSLIRLASGNLAYITRRIDRHKDRKIHMEDMCQLTGRLTEDKYKGSYEQVSRTIGQYSSRPGLDIVNFWELVVFSFLTGNADMHLKNFSLVDDGHGGFVLAPAYDLLSTRLLPLDDPDDMALQLNRRKDRLHLSDFIAAFRYAELDRIQQRRLLDRMHRVRPKWIEFIGISFLPDAQKQAYIDLIEERFERLRDHGGVMRQGV